jgi:hypothetical protein
MANDFDVFISHRTADDSSAVQLANDLEHKGIQVWIDDLNLEKVESFVNQINGALERSKFVLLFMTASYFEEGSGWTNAEWAATLAPDPMNRSHRIIPVLAENCPYIPTLIGHLDYIDIRGKAYKEGVKAIARIISGESTIADLTKNSNLLGVKIQGDGIVEQLRLNLLKIESLPRNIYSVPLLPLSNGKIPTKPELVEIIHEDRGFIPAFRVESEELISFHNVSIEETGVTPFIDVNVTEHLTEEYIVDHPYIVTSLLNMGLSRHLRKFRISTDDEKPHRYHFEPNDGPAERKISWNAGRRSTERTVVRSLTDSNGAIDSWLHQSAYLKFVFIEDNLYLQIRPTWVLTSDGYQVKTGPTIGKVISKWTNAERNQSVFYHLHFWAAFLAQNQISEKIFSISCGIQKCQIRRDLCSIELPYGISWDYRIPSDALAQAASEIEESFGILPGIEQD